MKNIYVILGSTRNGRNGEKVLSWVKAQLANQKHAGVKFEFVDLKDWPIPFVEYHMPPLMGEYPEGIVTKWAKFIEKADGFLIVTPEYNHGYPAVLKNALDVISKEWNDKPVSFVSYGAMAGGARAVEQLRQVVSILRMQALPDEVNIPAVWAAFDEAGNITNDHTNGQLETTVKALIGAAVGK